MAEIKQENIIKAIEWLTERVAEIQCQTAPEGTGYLKTPQQFVDDNVADKLERIRKVLEI